MAVKGMELPDTKLYKLVQRKIYSPRMRRSIGRNLLHVWEYGEGMGAWNTDTDFLPKAFAFSHTQQGHEYWAMVTDLLHGIGSLAAGEPTNQPTVTLP